MNEPVESLEQEIERTLPIWLCCLILAAVATAVIAVVVGVIHLAYVVSETDRWIVVPIGVAAVLFVAHWIIYGRRGC
jgi:hypothetical protein